MDFFIRLPEFNLFFDIVKDVALSLANTLFLKMTSEDIAQNWLDAFNDHNLDQLLSLYDDNAIHFSPKLKEMKPETNGLIKGRHALNAWWADAFERLATLHYKKVNIISNAEYAFIEYLRSVLGEDDLMVGEVLQIKDGKIISSRVYHS